jgi:hypothetical protein
MKNTIRQKILLPTLLTMLGTLPLQTLPAKVIVSFSPSTERVTADTSFNIKGTRSPGSSTRAFDTTQPISPLTGYTGPVFYGGYQWTNDQNLSRDITRNQIRNNWFDNDPAVLSVATTDTTFLFGGTQSIAAVYLFQQEDFLNGADEETLSLTSLEASIAGIYHGSEANVGTPEARFLVRNGSQYYLSNSILNWFVGYSATTYGLDANDLAAETWAPYDPSTALNFDQEAATFSEVNLDNITGVGIYFEDDSFAIVASGGQQWAIEFHSFEASAETAEAETWADYPLIGDGWANTEDFLGWVYPVGNWVYLQSLESFVYLNEEEITPSGAWAYFPKPAN